MGNNGSPRFHELLASMADTHNRKNADYSPGSDPFGNFRAAEEIGIPAWIGAWIRLQDKYRRCQSLIAQYTATGTIVPAVADEKLYDTLIDLANYALLVRCLYEEAQDG